MDQGKGGGHDETSDPVDHSHLNKADDVFLAKEDQDYDFLAEEDQDYDDAFLVEEDQDYDDASGVKDNGVEHKKLPPPPPPPTPAAAASVQDAGEVSLPGASGIGQEQPFYGVGVGSTTFYLGNLHWWTRDADIEDELCKYGKVRDLRIFLYEDCGKSKGYCQVEFYDPLAAAACKKALIGHEFNGRMCIVASTVQPFVRMTELDEVEATKAGEGINQGGNWDNRGYGRGNWGRGNNLGNGNRGHGNPMRNSGGGPIGMGGYVGISGGPMPPYRGVGSHGLVSYDNYSFYGRGMPMHGMGMWPGPDMGRWDGDENGGGKVAESGYGEEAASEHRYNEVDRDRGDLSNSMREKDRGSERDLPGTSEKIDRYVPRENNSDKYARDRERRRDRDRRREDRDKYADHHRFKEQSGKYSHNGKRI